MAEHDLFDTQEMAGLTDELKDEVSVLDNQIKACFNTQAGVAVMQHLLQITRQPAFDASLGLLDGIANGFSREGQVALVNYLQKRIARAEASRNV